MYLLVKKQYLIVSHGTIKNIDFSENIHNTTEMGEEI
jgi:hypothetical protein